MKAYWVAFGAGMLAVVIGGVLWVVSDRQLGLVLILGGMVIAVLGAIMRLVEWGMARGKRSLPC